MRGRGDSGQEMADSIPAPDPKANVAAERGGDAPHTPGTPPPRVVVQELTDMGGIQWPESVWRRLIEAGDHEGAQDLPALTPGARRQALGIAQVSIVAVKLLVDRIGTNRIAHHVFLPKKRQEVAERRLNFMTASVRSPRTLALGEMMIQESANLMSSIAAAASRQ